MADLEKLRGLIRVIVDDETCKCPRRRWQQREIIRERGSPHRGGLVSDEEMEGPDARR